MTTKEFNQEVRVLIVGETRAADERRALIEKRIAYIKTVKPFKHTETGSRQWCARDPNGDVFQFPAIYYDPSGNPTRTSKIFFKLKNDVLKAIKEECERLERLEEKI